MRGGCPADRVLLKGRRVIRCPGTWGERSMFVQRTIAAVAATAALFAAGAATAATASANIIEDPAVDTAAMGTAIEKALAGKTTGFAYAIAKNGQFAGSGKAGKARTGPDGDVNFTTSTRFDIASATKTFTA